jgi:CBS domain-containing protein
MSTSMTDINIADVLLPLDRIPITSAKTIFKESIEKMGKFNLGILNITDDNGKLIGIITDGDIRRIILKSQKPFAALFADDSILHANTSPLCVQLDSKVSDAIDIMEDNEIWDLPVIDQVGHLVGLLHLHPIVKSMMDS